MPIVLVAVHLEDCPEAVALGAASVASALREAFPDVPIHLVETFVHEGPEALVRKIRRLLNTSPLAKGQKEPAQSAPLPAMITGFSIYSWNRALMIEAARLLRAEIVNVFLFCGGPEVSARPRGLHKHEGGSFDTLIKGEGEKEAVRVLGEQFFQNAPAPVCLTQELNALPSPWLDGTLIASEHHGVLWDLARGCPYSCAYCYESKGARNAQRVRYFPQERIRSELALFLQKKVPYVFVLDPTFNSDNKRAIAIMNMIEQESVAFNAAGGASDTHWHFEVRAELLNRQQAQHFAKIGASLQIGLQTVNPKSAALIGRLHFNRGQFESKINLLIEEDVLFGLDIIYGLPGDTLADYKKSLDFSLSLYPNNLDMFRLSVLPGTVLWDRASELGLYANSEAPYEVISTPDCSASDLNRAESLSRAADRFYNQGRAVAWFNQLLYPLKMKPSLFLEGFMEFCKAAPENNGDVEKAQLAYLDAVYTKAKKRRLFPAVQDIVRFNGAWARALVEGISTDITFHYDPEAVLGEAGLDIESFVASCKKTNQAPVKGRVQPGKCGPELLLL
ncbi:MAG: radical SAM protein [Spirochaetaceae bacterium]|jgi:hypothetical protein|nr:radical SAM protein [Spirochaetaceae bacterium]